MTERAMGVCQECGLVECPKDDLGLSINYLAHDPNKNLAPYFVCLCGRKAYLRGALEVGGHQPGCAAWFYGDAECDSKCEDLGKIGLGDYLEQLRTDLQHFVKFWDNGMAVDSRIFPGKLSPGEWDEQFRVWRKQRLRQKRTEEAQSKVEHQDPEGDG